jgi:hypothetical protein
MRRAAKDKKRLTSKIAYEVEVGPCEKIRRTRAVYGLGSSTNAKRWSTVR